MKRNILIACLALLYSNTAFATVPTGAERFLANFDFEKDSVGLYKEIGNAGSCMPRPQAVLDAYELELRRIGMRIGKTTEGRYKFYIHVVGNENNGFCSVALEMGLKSRMTLVKLTLYGADMTLMTIPIWHTGILLTGPTPSMQKMIENSARKFINDLFLELARSKD